MTLRVDIREHDATAVLTRGADLLPAAWEEIARAIRGIDPLTFVGPDRIEIGWDRFLLLTPAIVHAQSRFSFTASYSSEARRRLNTYVSEVRQVAEVRGDPGTGLGISEQELRSRLNDRGWDFSRRDFTREQVRDGLKILSVAHGANFSVPGSGKTTVALATHLAACQSSTRMLVVAPKNAFPAWDEVLADCLQDQSTQFTRLRGGRHAIRLLLADDPAFAIISYGQLIRVTDLVLQHFVQHEVHLVLDESHRIKAGPDSISGESAMRIGPLAVRRDILSGTPMPNDISDLSSQFDFLWPAQGLGAQIEASTSASVVLGPLYARTLKRELDLPELQVSYEAVEMSDSQRVLYGLLRDDALRLLHRSTRASGIMPGLNVSVMRLLQVSIDPQAAVQSMVRAGQLPSQSVDDFGDIAQRVMDEVISPRMAAVERQARRLAADGRKVVVWSPFLRSIEEFQRRLADLGVLVIHGGVQTGEEADDDTREGILRLFHHDPSRMVLVANPAAGGEGISLHRICHDAIFLGRTYNAAHYLQARDRIHRLGLPRGTETRITIYECKAPTRLGSIDLSVRRRLDAKVLRMSEALNDVDLRQLALESRTADPSLDDGLTFADLQDLVLELGGP